MDYLHHLNRLKSIIINNNLIKIKSIVYTYTLVALKKFEVDLIIIDVPIGTF